MESGKSWSQASHRVRDVIESGVPMFEGSVYEST
jgi:hypothetical protein